MSKVLLVDLDSRIPNLALMKLSAWHRAQGDDVGFHTSKPDLVYVSCVFTKNRSRAELVKLVYPNAVIGGSGWDVDVKLPPEVEAVWPDYSLYGIDYGLGYTSRGCIRSCRFCIVPAKEGAIQSVATIAELENPASKFVVLLDNNFLANPDCEARFQEIEDRQLTVSFTQGLDIRLVNGHIAERLARIRFSNLKRTKGQLHFAFDHLGIERAVRFGVARLVDAGIKPYRLAFYVLVGFDSTFEEDMERFQILRSLGVDPFVMIYDKANRQARHFSRWVNRRIYKSCEWEDYTGWNKQRQQAELGL